MKRKTKKVFSAILSVLLFAGTTALFTGCFKPNITPQQRYIDARDGFTDALSRSPLRLLPEIADADGINCDITIDKGDGSSPLLVNVYAAKNGDDSVETVTAEYEGQKYSLRNELLGGELYQSYPASTDDYLIFDGEMKDYVEAIGDLFDVNSDGILRVTSKYATPERITMAEEQIEIDGKTVAAEKYTLSLDRDVLEEICDDLVPEELFDRVADAEEELDKVIDRIDRNRIFDFKEDSKYTASFWQVRGATRKAEFSASEEDKSVTLTADIKSDVDSVLIDFVLSAEEDEKLTFGLPVSVSYTEKDGKFDWRLTVDTANAVIPEIDDIGVYGGESDYMPEFSGLSLKATGTYADGTLKGNLSVAIEIAGGELTQSFSAGFTVERETPTGPVTFKVTPGLEIGGNAKITGKASAADYVPGEYDPKNAIRYSEIDGEDSERYEEYVKSSDSLTMLLNTFFSGPDYDEPEPDYSTYSLAISDGVGESYTFSSYDPGDGTRIRLLPLTFADGIASFEVDGEAVSIDYENEQDKVTIGGEEFHCSYEKYDGSIMIFVSLSHGLYQYLGGDSYVLTVEFDDPETSYVTWYRQFFYKTDGDEYVCHLPEGDVTFTYHEGDATVVIDGKEFDVRDY